MLFVVSGVPRGFWNGSPTGKEGLLYAALIASFFPEVISIL